MKIAVGADSAGKPLLDVIEAHLKSKPGHEITNLSQQGYYADLSANLAHKVKDGEYERGILICGTGIGMCIAANKLRGIRAALAQDELSAQLSRTHNDANVLCLSADLIGHTLVKRIVDTWVRTPFDGGRHLRRLHKIEAIERGEDPSSLRA